MDKYLLEQWNNCVDVNDTVYILGDLFFRNAVSANEYLNRLHGKKHLIKSWGVSYSPKESLISFADEVSNNTRWECSFRVNEKGYVNWRTAVSR